MAYTFTRTGAQIEEIHNTVEDPKSNTQFSDDIRTIAGEYRGLWPDTGGIANKGDTYQTQVSGTPTGQYFTALQDTTADPVGDDVNWREVVSVDSFSKYTDIVYKASGGNSAVENMLFDLNLNPLMYAIGTYIKTGGTTWEYTDSTGPITTDNFRAFNAVNVMDFGAIGRGVTDDTVASQDAINCAKQQSNPGFARAKVYYPSGFYKITSRLTVDSSVEIVGDGMFATVFDSRTSADELFLVTAGRCKLSGFGMLHGTDGGIILRQADKSCLEDIFTGVGSIGGTSYLNDSSQNVKFERCHASTNGTQLTGDYSIKPDKGFRFIDGTTAGRSFADRDVTNMSVLIDCQAEGMRVSGYENYNDIATHRGQGYNKLFGCTFQGNATNMIVDGATDVKTYGCHLEVSTNDGLLLNKVQGFQWNGGPLGDVRITGECVGIELKSAFLSSLIEDDLSIGSRYIDCTYVSNSSYKFSQLSTVKNGLSSGNYNLDVNRTNISEKDAGYGEVLTSNGRFNKWASSTAPADFQTEGAATLSKDTIRRAGVSSCRITCSGTDNTQGLGFFIPSQLLGEQSWLSVGVWVFRPVGYTDTINILLNTTYPIISPILEGETPQGQWSFVSRAFRVDDRDSRLVICPSSAPSGGEYIIVDELVVKTGRASTSTYTSVNKGKLAFGVENDQYISVEAMSAAPTTGNYKRGDVVFNIDPSVGGFIGWSCVASGSPGTWKPWGAISA